MGLRKVNRVTPYCLAIMVLIGGFFQNCSRVQMSVDNDVLSGKLSGNGGAYGGMVKMTYRYFDSVAQCAGTDLKGRPLPNTIILFKDTQSGLVRPFLTRDLCRDLDTPSEVAANDINVNEANPETLIYKNNILSSRNPPNEIDIVAASCPSGKNAIPGVSRTNSLASALDWLQLQTVVNGLWTPGWQHHPGIGVRLDSTLASLPAFQVERNDSNYLEFFRRAYQNVYLQPNTYYAFTFLAKPGSVKGVQFNYYRQLGQPVDPVNEEVVVSFDFQTGTTRTEWNFNVPNLTAVMTPLENGYLCTVYFSTSSITVPANSSVGIMPYAPGATNSQLGDSVVATAAELVPVNQFCR